MALLFDGLLGDFEGIRHVLSVLGTT